MQPQQQPTGNQTAPQGQSTNGPVQTVRSGAIGASIWQNENDTISITLSRSWKPSETEDFRHSKNFFARNREQLHETIDKACDVAEGLERALKQRVQKLSGQVSNEQQ